ncbi:MAG: endonuclease/exonuclease/phosphatase family protein [Maritimibacter sp.]
MKVASYNIRKAIGTDRARNPGRVIDVINAIEADVVVLQEADRRLGQRPAALPREMLEAHSDFAPVPLALNDVSLGWHGNAILLRKDARFSAPRRIDLPGFEPRGAVAVDLAGVTLVGVHLGLLRRHRHLQLRALGAALGTGPTIIAGDFNEWSKRVGLEPFEGRFHMHSPGRSFHANRPMAALDKIGHSDGLNLHDAGVIETRLARRASDHLPVWAKITPPAGAHG